MQTFTESQQELKDKVLLLEKFSEFLSDNGWLDDDFDPELVLQFLENDK